MTLVRSHSVGRSLTLATVAASWLLLAPAPAAAQLVFKLDHFKCYITTNQPVAVPVKLQDQFDRQISRTFHEDAIVWRPVRFCNPVEKRREDTNEVTPILNPESHLKFYRIHVDDLDLAPTRRVVIVNQFGKKSIRTFGQEVLATPTTKNNEPPHHDLDHFKCYRAYGANINRFVTLRDQFKVDEQVKVLYPFIFCNPTQKIHNNETTPIQNEEDHLVCYKFARRVFTGAVTARNQFGVEELILRDADLLCVPSKKRKVVVQ